MTLYVLDSDHVTLHQRGDIIVINRLAALPSQQTYTSIITVEEQLRGWLAVIRRAQQPKQLVSAYASLHRAIVYFSRINVLDYSEKAAERFVALRAEKIRIGTKDLRIAAIALAVGGIVVTRNQRDFRQVPDVITEDWSESFSAH